MKPMTRDQIKDKWPHSRTYLIQRLKDPGKEVSFNGKRVDQVFAFGGGGSGLSDAAWDLLKPCFAFDYMGAAEFEFGALPKSLLKMTQLKLSSFTVTIPVKEVADNYERKHVEYLKKKGKEISAVIEEKKPATFYVICPPKYAEYATEVIRNLAAYSDDWNKQIHLKESARMGDALDPIAPYHTGGIVGWYELDTGFFFFIDKGMFERTKEVFKSWFVDEAKPTASAG